MPKRSREGSPREFTIRGASGAVVTARYDPRRPRAQDPDPVSPAEIERISREGLAKVVAAGAVPVLRGVPGHDAAEPIRSTVSRAAKARLVDRATREGKSLAQVLRELVERHA